MLAVLMEQQLSAIAVTFEFVGVAVVDFAFSTFVTTAEILFVPPEGRPACVFVPADSVCASLFASITALDDMKHQVPANLIWHVGTASIELIFCAYALWVAKSARSRVLEKLVARKQKHGLSLEAVSSPLNLRSRAWDTNAAVLASKKALIMITNQIRALSALFFLLFIYAGVCQRPSKTQN